MTQNGKHNRKHDNGDDLQMSAFKAYDIRGIWDRDLDADLVYRIGRCLPKLLDARRVLIGRDVRTSSPIAAESLRRGLTEAGADVDDMGLCTTPMTYYYVAEYGYDAAVMITASHNSKEYNGLKISRRGALPVGVDSGLLELESMVGKELPSASVNPGVVKQVNYLEDYLAYHRRNLGSLEGLRFVVDCSNGMAGLLARKLFGEANATFLNEELDGTFPNHPPNPLLPEATAQLGKAVVSSGAHLGVIFDGDADRVAFVDSQGKFVRPDIMTGILAQHYLAKEPGAAILCDIRTSRGVTEYVSKLGGAPHLWKVGHAFAKVKLRELHAIVGGELAGHYYFRDFHHCDSSVLCASIILTHAAEAIRRGQTFRDLLAPIDVYANSGECNYVIHEKDAAILAVETWMKTLPEPERILDFDGIRCDWSDWWFNLRKSNTEPYLRLILEAKSEALLLSRKEAIEQVLKPFMDA